MTSLAQTRWCAGPDCPHPARYANLCDAHYQQQRRRGVLTPLRETLLPSPVPSPQLLAVMRELAPQLRESANIRGLAHRLLDLAQTADPPAAADPTAVIDLDCYQLGLQRLVDACQGVCLPDHVRQAVDDAEELLHAIASNPAGANTRRAQHEYKQ